jgi:predicted SAM-dependent methyltransferase
LERREKLTSGLDLQNSVGIEIGPLDRPVVTRQDGKIMYVDHTDTAELKEKYKNDSNVDISKIVNVDAVWGTQTLQAAIGQDRKVDYIIASHVIEHVPDLITWLEELRMVLKPGGELRLAVPDRRFTFDYLRRESTLADILNAHLARARIPLPIAILDHCLNAATVSHIDAWEQRLDSSRIESTYTVDDAMRIARDSIVNCKYHDVHCWVFTPQSFAALFAKAGEAGLIRFACRKFYDTAQHHIEFFVTLRVCDTRDEVVESWRSMQQAVTPPKADAVATPAMTLESDEAVVPIKCHLEHLEALAAEQGTLIQRLLERDSADFARLQRKLEAMYTSTSWRITAPLRAAVDFVRRQR